MSVLIEFIDFDGELQEGILYETKVGGLLVDVGSIWAIFVKNEQVTAINGYKRNNKPVFCPQAIINGGVFVEANLIPEPKPRLVQRTKWHDGGYSTGLQVTSEELPNLVSNADWSNLQWCFFNVLYPNITEPEPGWECN
jgi:hypothetical protein